MATTLQLDILNHTSSAVAVAASYATPDGRLAWLEAQPLYLPADGERHSLQLPLPEAVAQGPGGLTLWMYGVPWSDVAAPPAVPPLLTRQVSWEAAVASSATEPVRLAAGSPPNGDVWVVWVLVALLVAAGLSIGVLLLVRLVRNRRAAALAAGTAAPTLDGAVVENEGGGGAVKSSSVRSPPPADSHRGRGF